MNAVMNAVMNTVIDTVMNPVWNPVINAVKNTITVPVMNTRLAHNKKGMLDQTFLWICVSK